MSQEKKKVIFWPDNGFSLSFGILLSLGVYGYCVHQIADLSNKVEIHIFVLACIILFIFRQRIVIDDNKVNGPSAYGKFRRTTIKIKSTEAFYVKRKLGFGYIVIRDKFSNKQIFANTSLFSPETLTKLRKDFPPKEI